jgi:hypothetical protein
MSAENSEQERAPMLLSTHREPSGKGKELAAATTTTVSVVDPSRRHSSAGTQDGRDNWSSRVVYLLSIIGFVVDLGQ